MSHEPKRLPGERNPESARVDGPDRAAGGRGNDYGIACGLFALLDRRKRRKAIKARRSMP